MRSVLTLAVVICAWAQPDPTIRVNVNLIQVDVTVTARGTQRVSDLTAADFEVSRDGKRQEIKSVIWVPGQRVGQSPTATKASTAESGAGAGDLRPEEVRRTIAIMIDDLSLSMASVHYTRGALRHFVEENMQDRDLVAIYRASSGLSMLQQFTTNKRQLLASIERVSFGSMLAFDPLAPVSVSPLENSSDPAIASMARESQMRDDLNNRNLQDIRTAAMLGAVNLAVRGLRELPGRKSMVLISESLQLFDAPPSFNNPDLAVFNQRAGAMAGKRERTDTALRSLVDVANRSGVMISTLDPRGLVVTSVQAGDDLSNASTQRINGLMNQRQMDLALSQDGMGLLAEQTGGVFYRNTNDITAALKSALDDQEGYYLVAFQPDDETFEKAKDAPKFHRLTVKVKRPGTSVRYRRGFYGTPDTEIAATAHPLVKTVLSPLRASQIPLKLTPVFMQGEGRTAFLRVLLHIDAAGLSLTEVAAEATDPNREPWQHAALNELVLLFDETGKLVDQVAHPQTIKARGELLARLRRHGLDQQLDVPVPRSGPYQIRAAVMDAGSKQMGSAAQFIEVPDLSENRLALSTVVVSSTAWAEGKDPSGSASQRVLRAGGELTYAVHIYNASPTKGESRPNLVTQLRLFREGVLIYTGGKTPMRPEGLKDLQNLSLRGKLKVNGAPGDYVLEVAVRDLAAPAKHQFAVRSVDFSVQPPERETTQGAR